MERKMQRTVNGNIITHATVSIENGNIKTIVDKTIVDIKDTAIAKKFFVKKNPDKAIVDITPCRRVYMLDDDIFFKYAKCVEDSLEIGAVEEAEEVEEEA